MTDITPAQAYDLATQLLARGQLREAESVFRQILMREPNHADSLHRLGVVMSQLGQGDEAAALIRRAIELAPDSAEYHNNLAVVLERQGDRSAAIAELREALARNPQLVQTQFNLANLLNLDGQADEAIATYRQVIAAKPDYVEAYARLGKLLDARGSFDESLQVFQTLVALTPSSPDSQGMLGNALHHAGRLEEAAAAFRASIALRPDFPEAHYSLGNVLKDMGHVDEAIASYEQALSLRPDYPSALWNRVLALLLKGDFERGWPAHEVRWKTSRIPLDGGLPQPLWDGSDLAGRRILLRLEQGFGDMIQFIRYAPMVAERGGRVIVQCPPTLRRLVEGQCGIEQIVTDQEPLPEFDVHYPLLSLAGLFGTRLDNVPNDVPYLLPTSELVDKWGAKLSEQPAGFRVGIAWAGNPQHNNDHNRSLPLEQMSRLAQVPGTRFFSLQKGERAREAQSPPSGMKVVDWSDRFEDFADTAALISHLDLVIACDTAVAHLAGAMGRPVWVLLPFAPDWRWMLNRPDSPWYPTMRLFRQPRPRDWASVLDEATPALAELVQSSKSQ